MILGSGSGSVKQCFSLHFLQEWSKWNDTGSGKIMSEGRTGEDITIGSFIEQERR